MYLRVLQRAAGAWGGRLGGCGRGVIGNVGFFHFLEMPSGYEATLAFTPLPSVHGSAESGSCLEQGPVQLRPNRCRPQVGRLGTLSAG